ncbi:MAG: zf-TFIIB domain-containing protein [Planctomycetota bacterium]|nr:zf-TFIIB domain-containing protein [Planctomycetota bacterium]
MDGLIHDSVGCGRCGYALHGLPAGGVCPECGGPTMRDAPCCPRCRVGKVERVALRVAKDGRGVWTCGVCGGLAVSFVDLPRAVREYPIDVRAPVTHDLVAQSAATCPMCDEAAESIAMDTVTIVERCGTCRVVWLDARELAAVVKWVRDTIGHETPPEELARSLGIGGI